MSIYSDMRSVFDELATSTDFDQGTMSYIEMQPNPGATPDDPGEPVAVSHSFKGFARPVSTKYLGGTHIVSTDLQLALPGSLGVVPNMDGFIDIGAVRYKMVQIDPIPAAGPPVTYRVFVRR